MDKITREREREKEGSSLWLSEMCTFASFKHRLPAYMYRNIDTIQIHLVTAHVQLPTCAQTKPAYKQLRGCADTYKQEKLCFGRSPHPREL